METIAPNTFNEVCAIITTYNPDKIFPKRVEYVRNQVGMVVIVNDGESFENKLLK
jgi:hypothetical protein